MSYVDTITVKNDNLEIARGLMEDVSPLFISGYQSDLDRNRHQTLWDGDYDYTFSTVADIGLLVSLSDNDAGKVFRVRGLDEEWKETELFVTCDGRTPVPLSTQLIRINSIRQVSGLVNEGKISVYITGGSISNQSDIRAVIHNGFGKTKMGIFSVPAETDAFFNDFSTRVRRRSSTGDISANIYAEVRLFGGDFVKEIVLPIHTEGGQQNITSDNYFKIPAKSDIRIFVDNDSSSNGVFSANINGKLIKRDL